MTVKYDAELCKRLEAEARDDDARMDDAPWSTTVGEGSDKISRTTIRDARGAVASTDCRPLEHRQDCLNASAIARTRNNLRPLADQLAAARTAINVLEEHADGLHEAIEDRDAELRARVVELTAARAEIDRLRKELTMARAAYESERAKEHDL